MSIEWPTEIGIYRIDISLNDAAILQSKFIEVYPNEFSLVKFRSYIGYKDEWNLIEMSIQPSTNIAQTDYLVIEFPTKALGDVTLFKNDGGTDLDNF